MNERILTFDLSLKRSAFACDKNGDVTWGARTFIKPSEPKFPDLRFNTFRRWAIEVIGTVNPTLVIYEVPTVHGGGDRGGKGQTMLEMTLRELCALRRVPVKSIYPSALKKFVTGSGKAEKLDMMDAMVSHFPHYDPQRDEGGDVADALGMLLWARAGCPMSESQVKKLERKKANATGRVPTRNT